MNIPKVTKADAAQFAKVWTENGIVILLPESSLQFAADFATVVRNAFIQTYIQQQQQAQAKKVIL